MKPRSIILTCLISLFCIGFSYARTIQINVSSNTHSISKYIYSIQYTGGDGGYNGQEPYDTTPNLINRVADLRAQLMRQGGGNNSTKYNWEAKAGSHPDWFDYHYRMIMKFVSVSSAPSIISKPCLRLRYWAKFQPEGAGNVIPVMWIQTLKSRPTE